ncbi:MAG: hypothetical protein WB809_05340 [Thermoplasmata archaeon]
MTPQRVPRPTERSVAEAGARYLEGEGYRTWIDPDGSDYFDLVARRGREVGLVEAKAAESRNVLAQALTRRVWGDWVAVLLGSFRAAERLELRTRGSRGEPVGIWTLKDGHVHVLRPARNWVRPGDPDPYLELKGRFGRILDALERGDLPPGIPWDGVAGSVRRASHGRKFREWRLDEGGTAER